MSWPWIEEFVRAVGSDADLQSVEAREGAAGKIRDVLTEAAAATSPSASENEEINSLLDACRVFMRDRRGIDKLLSAEALDSFLVVAEDQGWSSRAREEALKCMINSVYSRPEFVSEVLVAKGFTTRLMALAALGGTASLHWLVWKFLLVSCEAPELPRYLGKSIEAWKLIYATLFYGFNHGNQAGIIVGDRANLLLDLIKLITVLVNDMQWTAEQEKLYPEVYQTVHQIGGLLLEILRFKHAAISPLDAALVELKNKTMEVFMFLPGGLLAAFIQQQHNSNTNKEEQLYGEDRPLLSPVLTHLHTMLLLVRIEKTKPLQEMLPALIVCHNLAKTGDPSILASFKKAVLPASKTADASARTTRLFFKHLTFFLTCLDTDVRRYTSEWLFLLCDENAKEYTHHTGVGNAIGLLRMKGMA